MWHDVPPILLSQSVCDIDIVLLWRRGTECAIIILGEGGLLSTPASTRPDSKDHQSTGKSDSECFRYV